MDGNIIDDILTVSGLSGGGKTSAGNPSNYSSANPAQQKIYGGAQRARIAGFHVPDDVVDDFYDLTSLESGHNHYLPNGQVKLGAKTPDGDQAIGYSQVMGNTAKPYRAKGLDPYKEQDNIAIGLNEFAKGGSDPIARRLAYVGGGNSAALRYYQRTGQVPNWKLYSYLPNNKETYNPMSSARVGSLIPTASRFPMTIWSMGFLRRADSIHKRRAVHLPQLLPLLILLILRFLTIFLINRDCRLIILPLKIQLPINWFNQRMSPVISAP